MNEQISTQPTFTPPPPVNTSGQTATSPPLQPTVPKRGGRGKRLLWILLLVVALIGAGVAAAAYFFPTGSSVNANTNTVNTTVTNTNQSKTNTANANGNANRTNTNANINTNANTNSNVNTATNINVNANANVNNVNAGNTNTSSQPVSFRTDTDGDTLNDYLEAWFTTNTKNADSDADGFPDGREVVNGYSPLGRGALSSTGIQSSCSRNTLVTQLNLSSSDVTAFCAIAGDMLVSIQVMAANSQLFEDLDAKLSASCTAFQKVDATTCEATITNVLTSYFLNG